MLRYRIRGCLTNPCETPILFASVALNGERWLCDLCAVLGQLIRRSAMARPFLILTAICLALAGSAFAGTAGWRDSAEDRARARLENTSGPAEKQLLEKFA